MAEDSNGDAEAPAHVDNVSAANGLTMVLLMQAFANVHPAAAQVLRGRITAQADEIGKRFPGVAEFMRQYADSIKLADK